MKQKQILNSVYSHLNEQQDFCTGEVWLQGEKKKLNLKAYDGHFNMDTEYQREKKISLLCCFSLSVL